MLYHLSRFEDVWGPFRLFRYISFRSVGAMLLSLFIVIWLGPKIFNLLKKLNLKDVVRDESEIRELAKMHSQKSETPTMGGVLIMLAVAISVALFAKLNSFTMAALSVYFILGLVGSIDDLKKIKQKDSKGLSSLWKWLVQGLATFVLVYFLLNNTTIHLKMSELWIPLKKSPLVSMMPLSAIFLFAFLVIAGTSNAVNLTDGIDGLAIGCSITVVLAYSIFCYITGNINLSSYLSVNYLPGSEELCIICFALIGASIGFLWYNAYPAQIFMGDSGSLSIGGLIGAIAFMCQQPFTLIVIGGIFVLEALSVILQVGSFKLLKKRIFKMAPLHHHFELKNIHESKIIVRFWIVSFFLAAFGLLMSLKIR